MRKTLLASSLVIVLSSSIYAANDTTPVTTTATTAATATPTPSAAPSATSNAPVTSPTAATTNAASAPATTDQLALVSAAINCQLLLPPNTTIPIDVVISWSEHAVLQAFDYNNTNMDAKMNELKACFTDQGWQGYNDALTQSGNKSAIKTQKLTVSGQLQGKARAYVVKNKENQWSVNMPLQVVYQNDTEKLTQSLRIDLLVTRKVSGELGIIQIIAAPLGRSAEKTLQ